MSARVRVRVPASTSNLGAGFDCIGMAVGLWLTLDAWLERAQARPERDLVYQGFAAACRTAARRLPPDLVLRATSEIPMGRGLGSSAAARVAGAAAANAHGERPNSRSQPPRVSPRLTPLSSAVADQVKQVVAVVRDEATKSGKDPDVKSWASKTLPTVEGHLKQVQELNRSVVGTSGVKEKPNEKPDTRK